MTTAMMSTMITTVMVMTKPVMLITMQTMYAMIETAIKFPLLIQKPGTTTLEMHVRTADTSDKHEVVKEHNQPKMKTDMNTITFTLMATMTTILYQSTMRMNMI